MIHIFSHEGGTVTGVEYEDSTVICRLYDLTKQ